MGSYGARRVEEDDDLEGSDATRLGVSEQDVGWEDLEVASSSAGREMVFGSMVGKGILLASSDTALCSSSE